jgi:hypothetical protein
VYEPGWLGALSVVVQAEPSAPVDDPLVLTVQPQVLLLKYEPETVMVSPGPYVVLLTEMWACGLQAHAIAAGINAAATATITKAPRRPTPPAGALRRSPTGVPLSGSSS